MEKALKILLSTLVFLVGAIKPAHAQLCTGSLGDPVVDITFGAGANPGPPLKAATTAYQYNNTTCPNDGYYTVASSTYNCFGNTWHSLTSDHTGNANGYFMLINASYQPNDFYLDTVHGLCNNTTYEFAAWILNMDMPFACNATNIRPNITFTIETTTGTILGSYNTGDIQPTAYISWTQYGLYFTTPAGVSDVVLRMKNNALGGCGNDLALDDITFRPCGPLVTAGIPSLNNTSSVSLCAGDPSVLTFTANVSAGYVSPAYQWQVSTDGGTTWNNIPGAQTTSLVRNPTGPGSYLYRLAVGEGGNIAQTSCRVSSNLVTVIVNPLPIPAAANDGPQCAGAPIHLTAHQGSTYSWTGPGGFTASDSSVTLTNTTPASSGTYYVTVTSSAGCTQSDYTVVTVYANPIAQFAAPPLDCEKKLLSFTDQSTTVPGETLTKWSWTWGDGSSDSIENPVHVYDTAGTYPVTLITTTDKGCQSQPFNVTLTLHDLPRTNFGLPEICLADPTAAFFDSSSIADGTQSSFTYLWNFGDPTAGPGNANTSGLENPTHKYHAAGPYTVSLAVTSGDGCTQDTVKTFTVNGSFPVSAFTVGSVSGLCSNQPVILTNNSSVSPGNIIKVEIYWDYQNDPTIQTIDNAPYPGKTYSHAYPFFSSPATVNYLIHYIVYSGMTCVEETAQTITVNASPQVVFDSIGPVCIEVTPFVVTEGRETQGFSGTSRYSGRGISYEGLFNPRIAMPGTDTLQYTFTADNGCSAEASRTILVYPQPEANAGPDKYVLQGSSVTLDGSGAGDNISYLWTPDSAIDNAQIADPKVSPSDDITYTLSVTSVEGCTTRSSVLVTVLKPLVVPNAFSPNGDGINDTWIIRYLEEYPGADVQVFNRYGQPVFHSVGYATPWDGTFNGHPLPVATYYWIINPKNGRKQMSGSVTIIR